MHRRATLAILSVLLFTLATPAWARDCFRVSMPDQVTSGGAALALRGQGRRERGTANATVYVGGLYAPAGVVVRADAPPARWRLLLHFTQAQPRAALSTDLREAVARTAGAGFGPRVDALLALLPESSAVGDEVAFTATPGAGVELSVGGAPRGTVPGDDLARALFAAWFNDRAVDRAFARQILGGRCPAR